MVSVVFYISYVQRNLFADLLTLNRTKYIYGSFGCTNFRDFICAFCKFYFTCVYCIENRVFEPIEKKYRNISSIFVYYNHTILRLSCLIHKIVLFQFQVAIFQGLYTDSLLFQFKTISWVFYNHYIYERKCIPTEDMKYISMSHIHRKRPFTLVQ